MAHSIADNSRAARFFSGRIPKLAVIAALNVASATAFAATYTVTTSQNAGAGSLRQAMLDANASGAPGGVGGGANTINVTATGTIALSDALPMVFSNLSINGNGITIDGGNAHRCFFISGLPTTPNGTPQAITVSLQNINLAHCRAKGGDGGSSGWGGGGGMGAGGALFVNTSATVGLNAVGFDDNSAVGGDGGSVASGGASGGGGGGLGGAGGGLGGSGTGVGLQGCLDGGGGLGGDGGTGYCTPDGHGGSGGGGGVGGNGGNASPSGTGGSGGGGGFGGSGIGQISSNQGFNTAGSGYPGLAGGANGGGGGGGGIGGTDGQSGTLAGTGGTGGGMASGGGGGGITGSAGTADNGGGGGIGGGGGGSILVNSAGSSSAGGFGGGGAFAGSGGFGGGGGDQGNGGFGGGGGGGFSAGSGGFGGGGGGSNDISGTIGTGGFGGGRGGSSSSQSGGGGGAGFGGAIFVVDGGTLSFSGVAGLTNNQVTAGVGGTPAGMNGTASGIGVFAQGNGTLAFNLGNGALYTLSDGISDVQGSGGGNNSGSWGMNVGGDGTGAVVLGAANTYTGATEVASGALEIDGSVTSLTTVDAAGILVGIGTATNVLNNGIVAPGNATTSLVTGQPPGNYKFTVANFSQGSGARLDIGLDGSGDSTQLVVTGTAGLDGTLHLQFDESPAQGTTYTVLTAASISGAFADYRTNMPSVFGEISYAPHGVLFTVLGNDLIFRDGFEGANVVTTGACLSKQQFAAIPGSVLDNLAVCVPPFTTTISGNTVVACQTSLCPAAVTGCPTTLRAGTGTLSGTLTSGIYTIATPLTADTITAPLNISGLAGNVNCTATASNTTADLATQYAAAADYLGDAFIYSLDSVQANNLNTSLSSSGCGAYGPVITLLAPYVIPQIQTQVNKIIDANFPSGIVLAPGVGDTICPAP